MREAWKRVRVKVKKKEDVQEKGCSAKGGRRRRRKELKMSKKREWKRGEKE